MSETKYVKQKCLIWQQSLYLSEIFLKSCTVQPHLKGMKYDLCL